MDGQRSTSRFRDATKPYIRPATRVILALLLAGLLAIAWTNGSRQDLGDAVERVALLGAVFGMVVAYSDIAVGVDDTQVIVRNPFVLVHIPLHLIERVDARFGVYLRIRDSRLAIRVAAGTGLSGFKFASPRAFKDELQQQVDAAGGGLSSDRVRTRPKSTWALAVPAAIALAVGVVFVSHAAR